MNETLTIVVFAHNEADCIADLLADLRRQSVLADEEIRHAIVHLLCNGCTDATCDIARRATCDDPRFVVHEITKSGKANAWNLVGSLTPEDSHHIVFCDADIRILNTNAIEELLSCFGKPGVEIACSRPVKRFPERVPLWLKAVSGGVGGRHQDGVVCGQLYAARAEFVKKVTIPEPCLVEDGFVAASANTLCFQAEIDRSRVHACQTAEHSFYACCCISEFFFHDVRIALGTLINQKYFAFLHAKGEQMDPEPLYKTLQAESLSIIEKPSWSLTNIRSMIFRPSLKRAKGVATGRGLVKSFVLAPAFFAYVFVVYTVAFLHLRKATFRW